MRLRAAEMCPQTLRYVAHRFDEEVRWADEILADLGRRKEEFGSTPQMESALGGWKRRRADCARQRSWLRGLATRAENAHSAGGVQS